MRPTLVVLAEAADLAASPWRFQAHPEVWVLVAFVIGSWVYALRVIGPHTPEIGRAHV